ncbi:catalase family peroxidase [Paraburkholderia humisilvae]|uniref:Catalase-related peroxidase n=1 Tax=Paraburkholderia humisilvae TaxID=627669 RepID=A0A6J5EGX4_9BURK|nr:catalase family peroxidase [Paraburkholderia humisilvae]CAB3764987.1 Catalase-related peroxidase [Paraburkholderia humisilvae]
MAKTFDYLNKLLRSGWAYPSLLLRYAIIAVAIGGISFAYAFSAGWVGWPVHRAPLSATRVVNAFEATTGLHPGFRRNHAKGICVIGHFESNGAGARLSRARVFARGVVPVVGRFSVPGTNPAVADGESRLRSLALRFAVPDGGEWRTAMNSAPIFSVRTPDDFVAELAAHRVDKATGKPDPARIAAFEEQHPEARAFREWTRQHPASSDFDNAAYYSVSAFRFVSADGTSRYVRWSMVPDSVYRPVTASERRDPDFLAHRLVKTLAQGPLRWHLILAVAQPGDAITDATRVWPQTPDRERVDAGTLVIDSAQPQIDGPCRNIDFDPLVLPAGIEPSADPLLAARSATYMESFYRRMSEEVRFASKR